jgi:integrase
MQFDVRAAKALKAGDHLTVGDAPGLRLVASTAGKRAWIYRYKAPSTEMMKQIKIGEWPAMSAAQAGVQWENLRTARNAGRDPAGERRAERKATLAAPAKTTPGLLMRVGDLVDAYVEHAAVNRAVKGGLELRRTMATMLPADFRAFTPDQVSRALAYDLIRAYEETPVQALNLRRELGAAWEWGHDAGRLSETVPNWWRLILRGKLKSKGKRVAGEYAGVVKRVLQPSEVGAVLRFLPKMSTLTSDLLTLYLWTGCRGAEIVQMEGVEICEDADGALWWLLPKAKVKMRAHELATDIWVPLIGRAREIVLRRKESEGAGYLFPALRGDTPHVQQKVIGVAVWIHHNDCPSRPEEPRPRWGIPRWSPHDLRRTVRTQLAP